MSDQAEISRRSVLDTAALHELGRPYSLAAVRYKPQSVRGEKALVTFYIDARLAAERLNYVVGPEGWEDSYTPLLGTGLEMQGHFFPVECKLSVLGITKTDVGAYQSNTPDDKAWKSAYSDALKRAAVKFRVGAFLYAIPNLWAAYDQQSKRFSQSGIDYIERAYLRWLDNSEYNRFGDPLDHGDTVLPDDASAGADDVVIEFPEPAVR